MALSDNTAYHWQARTVDQTGRTSGWVAFGGNGESATDFRVTVAVTQIVFTGQPSNAVAGTAISPAVRVSAQDALGNTLSSFTGNVTVSLVSNPGGDTLSGTKTVAAQNGVATFADLSIARVGAGYTLQAAASKLSDTSAAFTITPAAAKRLVFTVQPTTAPAGAAISPAVQVTARDSFGNTATGFADSVFAAIGVNPGGGVLAGTVRRTAVAGVATFADLTIDKAGAGYTLVASGTGITNGTSAAFTITAATAGKLGITTQPPTAAESGVPLSQAPVLQIRDANGNPVSQAGVAVTASATPSAGSLASATATSDANGRATFTGLALSGPVGSYTLSFAASGLAPVTSNAITLSAGPASGVAIVTQPSPAAQSGVAFAQQPVVQLRDGAGNPVSQVGVTVTATIATGTGTLGGTATAVTNASGVASFTSLAISGPTGSYTLSFGATGLTPAVSGTITIGSGAATQLTLTTQPSAAAQSGAAFAQQPVLQLRDGAGNSVSQAGVTVTATIATGTGTLGGTVTAVTNASGVASFADLSISGTAGNYTLSFSATGLTAAVSGPITLSAGAATQLTLTTQPSAAAQSGVAFAQQPVLQLRDGAGNAVGQAGVTHRQRRRDDPPYPHDPTVDDRAERGGLRTAAGAPAARWGREPREPGGRECYGHDCHRYGNTGRHGDRGHNRERRGELRRSLDQRDGGELHVELRGTRSHTGRFRAYHDWCGHGNTARDHDPAAYDGAERRRLRAAAGRAAPRWRGQPGQPGRRDGDGRDRRGWRHPGRHAHGYHECERCRELHRPRHQRDDR